MARYKVLKSVAHSLAHSFVSVMNYQRDDYVMCHLLRRAEVTHHYQLYVDVLRERVGPMALLTRPIMESIAAYCSDFGRLVTSSGSALDMVADADLTVQCTPGRHASLCHQLALPQTPRSFGVSASAALRPTSCWMRCS